MYSDEMIKRYGGELIDIQNANRYDKFSLQLFTNKEIIQNHRIDITIQLDITHAVANFEKIIKKQYQDASLTAFLKWSLLQALKQHKHFNYRFIMEKWYHFSNLPLFMTVATGKEIRICDEVIENCCTMSFKEFLDAYKKKIDDAYNDIAANVSPELWGICHFIGNLPHLPFTAFSGQTIHNDPHRPKFTFGKRYTNGDKQLVPFAMSVSHANVDPVLLNAFLMTLDAVMKDPELF